MLKVAQRCLIQIPVTMMIVMIAMMMEIPLGHLLLRALQVRLQLLRVWPTTTKPKQSCFPAATFIEMMSSCCPCSLSPFFLPRHEKVLPQPHLTRRQREHLSGWGSEMICRAGLRALTSSGFNPAYVCVKCESV